MIHLVNDTHAGEFQPIVDEGLLTRYYPTHVSKVGVNPLPDSIRTVLVTDRLESFIYDVPTYYLRQDLLSPPLEVDDVVCRKLTGMTLAQYRAYRIALTHDEITQRSKRTAAKRWAAFAPVPYFPLLVEKTQKVGDVRYYEVNRGNLQQFLEELANCDFYAVDMETHKLDPRSGNVCMSVSMAEGLAHYIPAELIPAVLPHIKWERVTGTNLKYDLQCLDTYPEAVGEDTHPLSSILEVPLGQRSLSAGVLREFGYKMVEFTDIVPKGESIASIPHNVRMFYSCEDGDWARRLTVRMKPRLMPEQQPIYDIQRHLVPIVAEMEANGVRTDDNALQALQDRQEFDLSIFKNSIFGIVGHEFDLNSPKQMQRVLFGELGLKPTKYVKTGPSTDASVLEHYKSNGVVSLILQYREHDKLYSTYTKPLREKVHPKTGRIHPNFNIASVASGRFSCDDPNMENIPKTPEYRGCIVANFGNSLLKIDFDQLELRELAGQSGGCTMSRIFASGASIHAHTASIVCGVDESQIDKKSQEYLDGKRANFAILYGAYEGKLIEVGLAKDWDEAHALREQIRAAYPEEMDWIDEQRRRIQRERKAVTLFGRVRTWGSYVPADVVAREGFNHIIQGSGVEHVHIATIAAMPIIRKYPAVGLPRAGLINQIHDEILVECRDDVIEDLRDEVVPVMVSSNSSFPIPLTVTPEIGFRWMT